MIVRDRKARLCLLPSCKGKRFELVHKFPMDNDRAEKWKTILDMPELRDMPIEIIRKRFFICSKHFRKEDYKNCESRNLNKTAYPRLFLTPPTSNFNVSQLDKDITDVLPELPISNVLRTPPKILPTKIRIFPANCIKANNLDRIFKISANGKIRIDDGQVPKKFIIATSMNAIAKEKDSTNPTACDEQTTTLEVLSERKLVAELRKDPQEVPVAKDFDNKQAKLISKYMAALDTIYVGWQILKKMSTS